MTINRSVHRLMIVKRVKGGFMLQINDLKLIHRKDLSVILDDFNLVLNDGDKAVIIGEEGNGKSTLIKWIYDPSLVEDYIEAEGRKIQGNERLAYLPQEMPEADKDKSVYEFFSEQDFFWNLSPKDLAAYAKRFGVEQDFFYREQRIGTLSGGEKIKARLMLLLMSEPTVLLLDEPSNDIDIATLELLENVINDWKKIVLFVSHDETLIENTANMVVHIERIRRKTVPRYTIAKLPYRQYVEERLHLFEHQEQQAENEKREKKIRDEKLGRIMQSVESAQASISRQAPGVGASLKRKMHTLKSMEKRFEREDEEMTERPEQEEAIFFKLGDKASEMPNGKTVLEYSLPVLSVSVDDGERVLAKDIFLRVRGPEKICIVGPNGAGKTTLLRKIAEELLSRNDIRAEYMPQDYEDLLNLDMTPVDFLDKSGEKEERTRIRTYLGSLKYTVDEMEHPIRELSGGQKAKVLLLKMSLSDANVLILDEPTRNFSPLSGPVIRRMLKAFPGAIISISHDRKYIDEVADKIYELTPNGLK